MALSCTASRIDLVVSVANFALSLFRRSDCSPWLVAQTGPYVCPQHRGFSDLLRMPAKRRGVRLILNVNDIVTEFFASKFGAPPQSLHMRSLR